MSEKKLHLTGEIFGVLFDVNIIGDLAAPNHVSGLAGGHPVDLRIIDGKNKATIEGSLLGKPVVIMISD